MRKSAAFLSLSMLTLALPITAQARLRYDRPINIITSNYDLVDTTYIDRGRLDGVKVGDKFAVKFRDGKTATQVMVTGVFERMASVKIVDSWLLKDGQLADFKQRPMVVALERGARRPAPDITVKAKEAASKPAAAAVDAAAVENAMPPAAPGGEPASPDASLPPADGGLPAAPDAGLPPADGGLPAAPDAGLPPADAGLPGMDAGLPPADAGLPPAPDGGLPPAPDAGLPPAPDGGLPPAPAGDLPGDPGLLPPPM